MGKKNKIQAKLSDEELVPSTLGYFEETKKGYLGLILIFAILIGGAIFMPQITEYVNKLLGKTDDDIVVPVNNQNSNNNDNNTGEKIVMYDISDTLEFTYNNIKFSNFRVLDNKMSFNVENTTDQLIDFNTTKYYIETYSSDSTLLERHIFNTIKINPSSTMTQNIELLDNEIGKIGKIEVSKKDVKDYPDVTVQTNSNNEGLLICSNDNESITYIFDTNNNLLRIKDEINYSNDKSKEYSNKLLQYQSKVPTYNNKEGVSSSLVEISSGFTVTTEIELEKANIKQLNNDNYYDSQTLPKVINFEMESRGFSCK